MSKHLKLCSLLSKIFAASNQKVTGMVKHFAAPASSLRVLTEGTKDPIWASHLALI
jgi:hypothetical protein